MRHAREEPAPIEALLTLDPELALVWSPMTHWVEQPGCRYEACETDEQCTCQEDA